MGTYIIIGLLVLLVAGVLQSIFGDQLPKRYLDRACMGKQWRSRFPSATKQDIRKFLNIFTVDAFAFRSKHRLKFSPDDKVMDVYTTIYPPKWTIADCMELETFVLRLEKEYGFDLSKTWTPDLTLGDVFEMTAGNPNQTAKGIRQALKPITPSPQTVIIIHGMLLISIGIIAYFSSHFLERINHYFREPLQTFYSFHVFVRDWFPFSVAGFGILLWLDKLVYESLYRKTGRWLGMFWYRAWATILILYLLIFSFFVWMQWLRFGDIVSGG